MNDPKQELTISNDSTPASVGSVVATQLSTNLICFTATSVLVQELEEKYKDLKNLDVKDTQAYEKLVKAIADCRENRTATTKEKGVYKRPALDWNKAADEKANAIIKPLQKLEDTLKEEKQRIDDIKAENKRRIAEAALREKQGHQDALNNLRNMFPTMHVMNRDELQGSLDGLRGNQELDILEYGELLEEANDAVTDLRVRLNGAIAAIDKAAELKAKEEERAAKDAQTEKDAQANREALAAEKLEADSAKAEQDELMAEQAAKIKELEAAAAEPEKPTESPSNNLSGRTNIGPSMRHIPDIEPENSKGNEQPLSENPSLSEDDIHRLEQYIGDIRTIASFPPPIEDEALHRDLTRVVASLNKAGDWLTKAIEDRDGE